MTGKLIYSEEHARKFEQHLFTLQFLMFFISNARTGIVPFIKADHMKNDREFNGCF